MGFRAAFEAAQHEPWADRYTRYKKLRNQLRDVRAQSPPPTDAEAAARLAKFARRLDHSIESINLFALATVGEIAAAAAVAAAEMSDVAGMGTDARLRRLPPDAVWRVREVHATYCRVGEEVDLLMAYLSWNTRAVNKLLKQAVRTFGRAGFAYAASRRAHVSPDGEPVAAEAAVRAAVAGAGEQPTVADAATTRSSMNIDALAGMLRVEAAAVAAAATMSWPGAPRRAPRSR
jgi:hypothetical protein